MRDGWFELSLRQHHPSQRIVSSGTAWRQSDGLLKRHSRGYQIAPPQGEHALTVNGINPRGAVVFLIACVLSKYRQRQCEETKPHRGKLPVGRHSVKIGRAHV